MSTILSVQNICICTRVYAVLENEKLFFMFPLSDAAQKHKINRVDCETEIKKYLQKMSYKAD